MKKLLLTAGVAASMLFSAVGCGSTCCSRSSTSNSCPTNQCAPGTPTTTVTPATPTTTTGKPLTQAPMNGGMGSPSTGMMQAGGTEMTGVVMPK